MTESEAKKICNRLSKSYNNPPIDEFMRVLHPLNYMAANRAINELIDVSDFPSIPKFHEVYNNWCKYDEQQHKPNNKVECYVCMDIGYVTLKAEYNNTLIDESYWCDVCKRYPQNDVKSISSYIDSKELEQSNKLMHSGIVPMPDYVREKLNAFEHKFGRVL